MALTFTTHGAVLGDTGNTSPHTFTSRTYTAGRVYLACILSTKSNPAAVPTSVSGTGITFSLLRQSATFGAGIYILSLWAAKPAADTTTTVSVAHAATTGTAGIMVECPEGAAIAALLAQNPTPPAPVSTTTITAALAAPVTSGNASFTLVGFAANSATSTTPDTGWTASTGANFNSPASGLRAAWSETTPEQNVVWTGTAVSKAAIIVELAAAKAVTADAQALTLSTPAAGGVRAYRVAADARSWSMTGQAATLTHDTASLVPTTIVIDPASLALAVGSSASVTATVYDQFGAVMPGETVNVRTSEATVATAVVQSAGSILDISSANIARYTFEGATVTSTEISQGGAVGTLTMPTSWAADMAIVSDPVGTGRGDVLRINYGASASGQGTVDRSVSVGQDTDYGLGSTVYWAAEFLIPASANTDATQQRKLMYLKGGWDVIQQNDRYRIAPLLRGTNLYVSAKKEHSDGSTTVFYDEQAVIGTITPGEWFSLQVRAKINSAQSSTDGELQIWLNGTEVLPTLTGLNWTDTSWGTPDSSWTWYEWSYGDQAQDDDSSTGRPQEYRYLNNLAASTARIGL
jgi:hypothetical protein